MIGRVIDKYRIVEEVGQGGMSVVYKGMDTSLNREVAVKVLHPHLASSDEARKRFEREAHAVAKLRHENILEIYDYSGRESPDSYIVTELIRGHTLRHFIGEHTIAFPEIAAMITVETCRALVHAHTLGVLHRDVKPENIMIRDDGALKLMDFGIAQIVDSHRMTVTGQLLGSPAYMSPEHVEGRPLDFRTDVFSVGILLYQLATGELPFKGRNPHEILKRIAECRFLDARVVNPLVADRLNRIIMRALARMPEDRYPDVALLLEDLERFLAQVGILDARAELRRFFIEPEAYEASLRERLIGALTLAGKAELASKHTARALELWNRVLTIDPSNDTVLRLIDRLSRRRRLATVLTVAGALVVLGAGGVLAWRELEAAQAAQEQVVPIAPPPAQTIPAPIVAVAAPPDAAPPAPAVASVEPDAGTAGAPVAVATPPVEPSPRPARPERPEPTPPVKPPQPVNQQPRSFRLVPLPRNAFYSVDGGPWQQVSMGGVDVALGPGRHEISFRHPLCHDETVTISSSDSGRPLNVRLPWKRASVRAICPGASAILVDGKPAESGAALDVLDFNNVGKKNVVAEFMIGDGPLVRKQTTITAGDEKAEVRCDGG